MSVSKRGFAWRQQTTAPGCPTIDCRVYDSLRDFKRDPSGYYVLIRIDRVARRIEAALCDGGHTIVAIFRGGKCQDVYEEIFRYEHAHDLAWFRSKGHIAYLGKELKKAELALHGKRDYVQE